MNKHNYYPFIIFMLVNVKIALKFRSLVFASTKHVICHSQCCGKHVCHAIGALWLSTIKKPTRICGPLQTSFYSYDINTFSSTYV